MTGEIEPRQQTPSDVIAMIKQEIANRQMPEGTEIKFEIHYHASAPSPAHAQPEPRNDPMAPAARLAPYFVILLGGAVILAIIAVITILLVPAIMALATTLAIIACGVAVMFVAVAASIRSLRTSRADVAYARKGRK